MTILSLFLLGGKRIPTLSSQNSMILEGHIEIGKGGGPTTWSASLSIVSGEGKGKERTSVHHQV